MSETTNQMSLLDAIGFSAPEETKKPKKDKPAKAEATASKAGKKKQGKGREKPPVTAEGPVAEAPVSKADGTPVLPDLPAEVTAEATASEAAPLPAAEERQPLDKYLCFALYSANHAMHGVYKTLLKEIGLTYPQFLAMTVLWDTNNVPVGAITSKLQLDTNTLTPLLKRLEAMELLTRTRNAKDERQVILKLTRKGRALQKKTEHFAGCIFSATGLQLEEVMDLQEKVMKLRDNLRQAGLES
ncbi:MarR family winged helix-turn-helix transcriptional regulator [Roseibium sp.]|uniref:MarR family winged helix-turn-helix transcriptional regulator n=1 Tax=Roseibium sp. TaxID=1936156 RepID=UPI003D0E7219